MLLRELVVFIIVIDIYLYSLFTPAYRFPNQQDKQTVVSIKWQ